MGAVYAAHAADVECDSFGFFLSHRVVPRLFFMCFYWWCANISMSDKDISLLP